MTDPNRGRIETLNSLCYVFKILLIESYALWRIKAGSIFQKSVDKLFQKHNKYCRSYIDDVAIFSRTWEEHPDLGQIFQCITDAGLTVHLEKCNFGKNEVTFWGHVIGPGRFSTSNFFFISTTYD